MLSQIKRRIRANGFWERQYEKAARIKAYIKACPFMSDKRYIEKIYQARFGVKPNWTAPKGFNEKNNWRKLYDREPVYTRMVDKRCAKEFVRSILGDGYTFRLIDSWENPGDIDIAALPDTFVLKCNHSGGVFICRDKSKFPIELVRKKLREGLKTDYFLPSREWPYKNVQRCVICEEYMGESLTDYKVYCFNGAPKYIFVWENHPKSDGTKPEARFCGAYTAEWVRDPDIDLEYPSGNTQFSRPKCLEELLTITRKISENTIFLRVDCYIINDKPYVGEMTFFPWAGFMKFRNAVADQKLGNLERLPFEGAAQ